MYNFRTEEEDEISSEELESLSAERGRDFIPRIDLGLGMIGDGPAVGLYDVLVLQGRKPIDAIEEVLRTLIKRPTEEVSGFEIGREP